MREERLGRYESAEHEMVVVSHGGVVEERGRVRIARIFDDYVFDFGPLIRTSYMAVRKQFIGSIFTFPAKVIPAVNSFSLWTV